MAAYSLSEIGSMVHGVLKGNPGHDAVIRDLLTDSRRLIMPAGTLFVALKTEKNDGHRFIPDLYEKGVSCFMVSTLPAGYATQYPGAAFVLVDDTLAALQRLAAAHRNAHPLPVVAITGSNGKTIVKEWLFQLLMSRKNIVRNPKSYNSQVGVPLSVWQIHSGHELGVFEAGISRMGEMEKLQQVIQPDVGIFTNIGAAHDEGFSSREEKIAEKLKLFESCKGLVYCADHSPLHEAILRWRDSHPQLQLFCWSAAPGSDMQVLSRQVINQHTMIQVNFQGQVHDFRLPFADKASVENALHCLAFLFFSGYTNGWIRERMELLQPVAMRMEMKEGINNCLVINDSYNSDLNSLAIALDFLQAQSRHSSHTIILSDILQSGMPVADLYREVAAMLSARKINRLIGIGPDISSQWMQFGQPASFYPDSLTFIHEFDFSTLQGEAILLKGARVFEFERISNLLQQKDHQTILEINLDALVHNLNVFRSLVKPGVKVMAMVKAFSYGSGSVEVAGTLQYHRVDFLAVAYADEGKELRQGGIHIPIVVMNPEVRSFDILFQHHLEPEVYSIRLLQRLAAATASWPGISPDNPFPVHLKLDTGMHRLGFLPAETNALIELLQANPQLKVHSVFSHFAASDTADHDAFTLEQTGLFNTWCDLLQHRLGYGFLKHLCNTTAISRFPSAHFDMVRPGVGLYGVTGDEAVQPLLQQVSTFKSVVSQVKRVPAGHSIGYNRSGKATREMTIAIVPVGYADGLNRHLSDGRGQLFLNGKKVPVVGKISMDMCAVDVTGMEVNEGDEVVIFGKEHPVQEMAATLETIPYEIFTSVSQRVKRVYFRE
jgi:Alr-MurF fusion protein